MLLFADEPTPKEEKGVVEAAAEEVGALVAAGVDEEVVVVVAIENTGADVLDAGAELAVERLNPIEDWKPELAGGTNEKEEEEDDEAVCEGAEAEIVGVELPVLFKKENPVEAEKGGAEAGAGLVVVEEVMVDTPNGDGEEAAAPEEDDAKRDGVEPANEDDPKKDGDEPVAPKIDGE